MSRVALISIFLLAADGFRTRKARKGSFNADLITFGTPATASPALTNPRSSNGCFPGMRISNVYWWGPVKNVDQITAIAGVIGFSHAKQAAVELDTKNSTYETLDCEVPRTWSEPTGFPNGAQHEPEVYSSQTEKHSLVDRGVVELSLLRAHLDAQQAEEGIRPFGWRLVNSAFDNGEEVGGPQYSHLMQNPETLDCAVSFQGSKSSGDWWVNFDAAKTSFCGLEQRVHKGFRDHLLQIVRSEDWQTKIRPQLSGCRKVIITGHSLGGAKSELFAACTASAPRSGQDGFDDYKDMSWSKATPRRLAYLFD